MNATNYGEPIFVVGDVLGVDKRCHDERTYTVTRVYKKSGTWYMDIQSSSGHRHPGWLNDSREAQAVFVKDKFLSDVNHALESGK